MPNNVNDFITFVTFLFYGLVFFTAGVAITSKVTRSSKLTIARHLPLFALFAFVHACHEWLVLFLYLEWPTLPPHLLPIISALRLLPAFVSFVLLLFFGLSVLKSVYPRHRGRLNLFAFSLLTLFIASIMTQEIEFTSDFFRFVALRMRNFIAFPAALLAGFGLIGYAGTIRSQNDKVARNFIAAGFALIAYGIFAGLVPTGVVLLPGLRIELLRGISGLFILHFLMNAMHIFDLEREAQIEERLQRFAQSEKLASLGKLAAGIAHEINNPLANVSLNVELLKKTLDATDAGASYTKRFSAIERNLDRASKIARELLTFSRHDDLGVHVDLLDLNEVLRNTLTLLGPRQQDFHFVLDLQPLPPVRGIAWKVEEVFLNILINAMDASPAGAPITVASRSLGDEVLIEISDCGPGIPAEHRNAIFDPFFTTKEVGVGTGLGLSICFGIMERHGGRITVANAVPGGCIVTLTFPQGARDGA
ncbi:MAG: HAMP domain-containing sensor histidine kinase [Desulfuromonadales bacterium]|nr:HAMP domain-containing sensor histidine kinase [Desulfuromonadales bacterium]